jgi:hypothetical protein
MASAIASAVVLLAVHPSGASAEGSPQSTHKVTAAQDMTSTGLFTGELRYVTKHDSTLMAAKGWVRFNAAPNDSALVYAVDDRGNFSPLVKTTLFDNGGEYGFSLGIRRVYSDTPVKVCVHVSYHEYHDIVGCDTYSTSTTVGAERSAE